MLIMKVLNDKKFKDNNQAINEAIDKVVKLVTKWADDRDMSRVKECDGIIRIEEFTNINDYLYDSSIIRIKTRKT